MRLQFATCFWLITCSFVSKIENDCHGGCNRTVSTWCSVWWVKIQPAPHPLLFYPLDWLLYPMHTHQASKNSILIPPIYEESFANRIWRILNQGHSRCATIKVGIYSSLPNKRSAIFINFCRNLMRYFYFTCATFIYFQKFWMRNFY